MDATIYLNSLGLQGKPLTNVSVGRLIIRTDFFLGNDQGVVVHPKRGGISARYVDLLADNGVSFTALRFNEIPRYFAIDLSHPIVRHRLKLLSSGSVQRFVKKLN